MEYTQRSGPSAQIYGFNSIFGDDIVSVTSTIADTATISTIKVVNPIQDFNGNEYYPDISACNF